MSYFESKSQNISNTRIAIDLKRYYEDHRCLAWVFKNEKIKTIQQLQEHVSNIFKIDHFYLALQDQYLPPLEDVNIIQRDDLVTVVPLDPDECKIEYKKKKKRDKLGREFNDDESKKIREIDEICEETPRKRKKRESLEKKRIEEIKKVYADLNGFKGKKRPKHDSSSSHNSSSSEEQTKHKKFEKNIIPANISSTIIKPSNQFKKKINIIKTIIVSKGNDSPKPVENCQENIHDIEENDEKIETQINNENLYESLKRKRKRVRKKKLNKFENEDNVAQIQPTIVHLPENIEKTHIRFSEENVPKEKSVEEKIVPQEENIEIELENLLKQDLEKKTDFGELKKQNVPQNAVVTERNYLEIDEKFIENHPILRGPIKSGDVIAFKVLRIGENYTPEISSFIIGKMLSFDNETKKIKLMIEFGIDQCNEPNGKFSLESQEEEENFEREFNFQDLLHPRLL